VLDIILSTKFVFFFISIFFGGGGISRAPPSRLVARLLDCELPLSAAPLDPTLVSRPLLAALLARHYAVRIVARLCTLYA
jgi:hypothetical protein